MLDNRKDLTPRQSIEAITRYARVQDSAVRSRQVRMGRTGIILNAFLVAPLVTYITYELLLGYWVSIHPASVTISGIQGLFFKSREVFAPEIYLKDQERWKKDLRERELSAIKKQVHEE